MSVSINFSLAKAGQRSHKIIADGIDDIARIQVSGIRQGFIPGVDVDDRKYTPSIVNRRPIRLFDTGTMQAGVHVSTFTNPSAGEKKATITSGARSKAYAEVHNEGLGDMPERKWFPNDRIVKRTQRDVDHVVRNVGRKMVAAVK